MTEIELLRWLSKEDDSALGECYGPVLDALVEKGLAEIAGNPNDNYSRVSLTDAGWRALEEDR